VERQRLRKAFANYRDNTTGKARKQKVNEQKEKRSWKNVQGEKALISEPTQPQERLNAKPANGLR
jgi:hypothetical protein